MDITTILRVTFLLSLGIHLLYPNEVCRVLAAVSGIALGVLILVGRF